MLKLLLFLRNQMSSSSVVSFLKKFFPVKTKYSGKESVTLTISSLVTQGSTLITNDLSRLCDEVKCVDFEEESQYQHKLCRAIILFSSMFSCVCLFVCRLWFDNFSKTSKGAIATTANKRRINSMQVEVVRKRLCSTVVYRVKENVSKG